VVAFLFISAFDFIWARAIMCKVAFCTDAADRGTSTGSCKVTKFLTVIALWRSVNKLHGGPEIAVDRNMISDASICRIRIRKMNDK
jgi:hypothetical protein